MSSPTATRSTLSTNDQQPFSQQDIQLDDISLSTLRSLSSLCYEFRQSISHPALQRIKIGPPKAGHLGPIIRDYSSKFATIAGQCDCQQIFIRYSHLPGVGLLQTRLNELQETLEADFDDTSTGYAQRVHVLEKLNYENGKVSGVVDTIIEQHEYHLKNVSKQIAVVKQPFRQLGQFSCPKLLMPVLRSQLSTALRQIQPPLPGTQFGTSRMQASIPQQPSPLGSDGKGFPPFITKLNRTMAIPPWPLSMNRSWSCFQNSLGSRVQWQFGNGSSGPGMVAHQPPGPPKFNSY